MCLICQQVCESEVKVNALLFFIINFILSLLNVLFVKVTEVTLERPFSVYRTNTSLAYVY